MPIYEYVCEKCGLEIERVQKITDPPIAIHVDCGGRLKRLISNSSFILKGTGWYVTDYPSESRKKAGEAKTTAGKPASKTTPAKPETKPAGKAAPVPSTPAAPQ